MSVMIRQVTLPHSDPEASLRFYRDGLGLVAREDVRVGAMRSLACPISARSLQYRPGPSQRSRG